MSDVKTPKKGNAESKKTEAKKPKAEQSAPAAETTSADKPAGKADAAPKSASQSSISHFSSVSTPEYRSGWDSIFANGEASKKPKSTAATASDFPLHLTIEDDDIDSELRKILYKLFQKKSRSQGMSLAKAKKVASIAYTLNCDIREK
jgi:hypothetical protein